ISDWVGAGAETAAGARATPGAWGRVEPKVCRKLIPQPELADHREVPVPLGLPQVLEQVGPLADQTQKPAAAGEVLLVRPHVLGEGVDPLREQRDLHFGRSGVGIAPAELRDEFGLLVLCDRHRPSPLTPPRRTPA